MLSDVTISFGNQSISFPGLYLLIGCLIVLGLIGFIVAMTSSRRIERKSSELADILVVQLERIGDALDRIVSQNAARPANEAVRQQRDRFLPEWAVPARAGGASRVVPEGSALERAAQKPTAEQAAPLQASAVAQEKAGEKPKENQSDDKKADSASEPGRTILFSMLGR